MDIGYELELFVYIISSGIFIDQRSDISRTKKLIYDARFEVEIEIFSSQNYKWHIFGVNAIDFHEGLLFAFFTCSTILLEEGSKFLILILSQNKALLQVKIIQRVKKLSEVLLIIGNLKQN